MTKTDKIAEVFGFIPESPAQALADALAYEQYDRSERFEWSEPVKPAEQQLAEALAYEEPMPFGASWAREMEIERVKAEVERNKLQAVRALAVAGIISGEAAYACVKTVTGIEG